MKRLHTFTLATMAAFCLVNTVMAQEADIRQSIAANMPNVKQVDEITKTAMDGLYEVRANGSDIFYTDAKGSFLIEGRLIDLKSRRNLTEERVNKLTAVHWKDLPFKDAFTIVRGDGSRKLAVFEDPNCGYCKRFERDLQKINNVTVYLFLYPILGADSKTKSDAIWCSKDAAKTWQDWMVREVPIPAQQPAANACDTGALTRNVELGRKHKISGTPTLLFANDNRVPGAIDSKRVEQLLVEAGAQQQAANR